MELYLVKESLYKKKVHNIQIVQNLVFYVFVSLNQN